MGKIITVYSKTAYKEYQVPDTGNADYTILLSRRDFDMPESVKVRIEILSGSVYIAKSDAYEIKDLPAGAEKFLLSQGEKAYIKTEESGKFLFILTEMNEELSAFEKCSISARKSIVIGRDPEADITYDFMGFVSKKHAVISHDDSAGTWTIQNLSKNGLYVNRERVTESRKLSYGDSINIVGLRMIFLGDALAVAKEKIFGTFEPGTKIPDEDAKNGEECDRINAGAAEPAFAPGIFVPGSKVPAKVPAKETAKDPAQVIRIEQPVLGVPGWKETYREYLDLKGKEIAESCEGQKRYLLASYPSANEYLSNRSLPFWHRGIDDPDLMTIRVGEDDTDSLVQVEFDEEKLYLTDKKLSEHAREVLEEATRTAGVPRIMDLGDMNLFEADGFEQVTDILVQLTAHVPPSELKVACLYDKDLDEDADWESLRWLPHIWADDMSIRYFADDRETQGEILFRLSRILLSREGMSDEEIRNTKRYVVFISNRDVISGSVFEKYIRQDRYLGFTVITPRADTCSALQSAAAHDGSTGSLTDTCSKDKRKLDDFVRALAAAELGETEGIAIIPEFVSLLGTLGTNAAAGPSKSDPDSLMIRERWAKHRTYEHIRGTIGIGRGGMVRTLDLHERYNGPHVLVAGTTGSGKSELLKTILLSLAIEYSPDSLKFILVDFKGGGMANTLAGLPHIAGTVTNLSGGEIERAILAVRSEVTDRQKALSSIGASHIDEYEKLFERGEIAKPMSHIVIVVDEFAELKKEKPEMMQELISISELGRSLGIHLLLATQRPYGNVDDNIRSNVRTNICLRVQDKRDSIDVLGRPDAAFLTGSGRAYMKVGEGEVFEPFQAAFSGLGRVDTDGSRGSIMMLTPDGRSDIVMSFEQNHIGAAISQLDLIKSAIEKAAEAKGIEERQLWLDTLEDEISLDELKAADGAAGKPTAAGATTADGAAAATTIDSAADSAAIVLGMVDDPANRAKYPLTLSFPQAGNTAVVGMPSSGKTTFLYTLLSELAEAGGFDVRILDLDTGKLADFEGFDRVTRCVATKDELDIADFLDEIGEVIDRRKAASVSEARKNAGGSDEQCVVVIDSYEDLVSACGYRCEKKLAGLMREASGAGVSFVIAGGGFGLGQIPGSIEKSIKTVFSLQQRSIYDYMDALHTKDVTMVPEEDVPGRGLTVIDGKVLEFQTAYAQELSRD